MEHMNSNNFLYENTKVRNTLKALAINLYLARQFKLYGKNAEDEYQIDSLLCTFDDLLPAICKIAFAFSEEEQKQVEANKKASIEKLNLYYAVFEKDILQMEQRNIS